MTQLQVVGSPGLVGDRRGSPLIGATAPPRYVITFGPCPMPQAIVLLRRVVFLGLDFSTTIISEAE